MKIRVVIEYDPGFAEGVDKEHALRTERQHWLMGQIWPADIVDSGQGTFDISIVE